MISSGELYLSLCANPGGSDCEQSACNVRDPGSIPESRRSPGEGNEKPLQDSCWENPMQRSPIGYTPWGHKELSMTEHMRAQAITILPSHFCVGGAV